MTIIILSIYAAGSIALAAYWWYSFRRAESDEWRSELLQYRWPAIFGWPVLLTLGPLASLFLRRRQGRR